MKTRLTSFKKMFVAAAFFLSALSAHAVLLNPPGVNIALPGTTAFAEPQLGGLIIVDELIPFAIGSNITGVVQQRIVRSFDDGTLDFYWRVMNDANSAGAIGSFRIGDFVSPEYNANWRIDGTGDKAPDSAVHAICCSSFVNFNFNIKSTDPADGLLPGQSSFNFFLDTTATDFAKTAIYDLTNMAETSFSGLFAAYSPVTVPEPATLALMGLGLAGLGFGRRKRTR